MLKSSYLFPPHISDIESVSRSNLTTLRRELNRQADARLDLDDVFESVKAVVSKDALMEAGDLVISKKRRKKRKVRATETQAVAEPANPADQNSQDPIKIVA
jgi:hypothetical protein